MKTYTSPKGREVRVEYLTVLDKPRTFWHYTVGERRRVTTFNGHIASSPDVLSIFDKIYDQEVERLS